MKKESLKKKLIPLLIGTVAATSMFVYSKSSSAEFKADQDNVSVELNVEKIDKDTIKISLDNFTPVVKSLQLGVSIDGDVNFTEDTINWLVSSEDENLKSNVKISDDKKNMDIFIVSTEALNKVGGKLEICEIDVNKSVGASARYNVIANDYSYLLNDTNKQVTGADIANLDENGLTLNSAPKLELANHPSVIEGKIVISKDDNFEPLDYVVATDDEEGEIDKSKITVPKNEVKTDTVGSYNISYSVQDAEGEVVTLDTTVIVEEKPTVEVEKPVINVTNKVITTTLGEEVDLLDGVKAIDYLDREIQVEVSGDYDFNNAGNYTIRYNATDRLGNNADEVTATLVVKEVDEKPEVPEVPGEPENPEQPGNPDEPENPGNPGEPEVPENPEISLPDDIIDVGGNGTEESPMTYKTENIESLNQLVKQAQDKFKVVVLNRTVLNDGTQKYSIRLDKKGIITRLLGRTNSHYVAVIVPDTDEFNSVFSKLDKDDKEAPVIEYNGELNITVGNGANFEVPEVTAKDNLDRDVTVKVVIRDSNGKVIDKIDTTKAGKYTITYTAEDESGNKAKELVITVTVSEANVIPQPPVDEEKPGNTDTTNKPEKPGDTSKPVNPEKPGNQESAENNKNNYLPATGQGVYFGVTILMATLIIGAGAFMLAKRKNSSIK